MTGGRDPVRARRGRTGQHFGQLLPAGPCRAREIVQIQRVQHAFQGAQDLVPPGAFDGEFPHQFREYLDVQDQMPDLLVQHRQVRGGEPVERPVTRRPHVPERCRREAVFQHGGVGRRLQQQRDRLAPAAGAATVRWRLRG
jgi:hypothetical protein